ncbi:DUF1697 domain-containing protein [soil metagenome]
MKYAAFIRGIGPGDPAKSNASLCKVFEDLGYDDVRAFISSGNILFETDITDTDNLELMIEKALTDQLGFTANVIVRSQPQLAAFVASQPFGTKQHSRTEYLTVTFIKANRAEQGVELTKAPLGKSFHLLSYNPDIHAVCGITNTTVGKTPDFMVWLERQYGKDITTRTFNTIQRVLAKLD